MTNLPTVVGYESDEDDPVLVFPKTAFANAEEFYGDFEQAGIPFFKDFAIQAVPDEAADGTPNVCYKNAVIT